MLILNESKDTKPLTAWETLPTVSQAPVADELTAWQSMLHSLPTKVNLALVSLRPGKC